MSKNITNKAIFLFIVIFVIVNSIGTYFFLYDENFYQAVTTSFVSSLFVLVIFIVKRSWDTKQEKDFK